MFVGWDPLRPRSSSKPIPAFEISISTRATPPRGHCGRAFYLTPSPGSLTLSSATGGSSASACGTCGTRESGMSATTTATTIVWCGQWRLLDCRRRTLGASLSGRPCSWPGGLPLEKKSTGRVCAWRGRQLRCRLRKRRLLRSACACSPLRVGLGRGRKMKSPKRKRRKIPIRSSVTRTSCDRRCSGHRGTPCR
jgi:hypothetical protein